MIKVLITGISGLLGAELYRTFSDDKKLYSVIGLSRHRPAFLDESSHIKSDIADFSDTFAKITKLNPEIIINTAAVSNVDDCEKNPAETYRINALGARNIAIAARRFDSYLIHISTDYVFGGKPPSKRDGYTEYEEPAPINEYGRSKLWGEYMIKESGAAFAIIRTSWIFGTGRDNYITQFADGKNISAADDMVSSPTSAQDLSKAIKKLIDDSFSKSGEQLRRNGIYHITNQGYASRYEIALFVSQTLGLSSNRIKKVKVSELKNLIAQRPPFSALKSTLWELDGFSPLRDWRDAVKDFIINR